MFNGQKFSWLLLVIITVMAGLIRFWPLPNFPPGLTWDEASLGYNAYSMGLTGRDEWGQAFPLLFRAFGDAKLPGYIYASVLPVMAGGLSPSMVRLPSALAGTLLPLIMFLILRRSRLTPLSALFGSLVAAISPWSWFLSRGAFEANLALTFALVGAAAYLSRRPYCALIFWVFSAYTYNSFRVFIPILFIGLWLTRLRSVKLLFLAIILFLPLVFQILSGAGLSRLRHLSLIDIGAVAAIESARAASNLPSWFTRVVYNRPLYFLINAVFNYLKSFSPRFLFIQGGSQYQFNPPHTPLLYPAIFPWLFFGLISLLVRFQRHKLSGVNYLWLTWLLLAPIPASVTRDAPHTLRLLPLLPGLIWLISHGWEWLNLLKMGKAVSALLIVLTGVSLAYYYQISLPQYTREFAPAWQSESVAWSKVISTAALPSDRLLITKKFAEPHIFILFNSAYPPARYQSDPHLIRYARSDWYWVDAFDRYRLVNDWDLISVASGLHDGHTLVICAPPNCPSVAPLAKYNYPNGNVGWQLIRL